ncbi:RNA polymerase sigma factor [Roseobacter denitrificans]|uniref:RNA polymerase sigma factor n=1 Tax=Roseobacter denitrificans TaxID=2434 RepID=UPI0003263D04|nr:RNA polymerase sigma factor [Roseobacter denitrificans]AVL54863.1 RNA polymerase sigma factor [Roseobacter denitrificans]
MATAAISDLKLCIWGSSRSFFKKAGHHRGCEANTRGAEFIHSAGNRKRGVEAVSAGLPDLFPRLWRFCMVLTKATDRADDLAQKTCERALANAEKFNVGTDLDRWLFTIARRIWLNDIRADKVCLGAGVVPVEEIDVPNNNPHVDVNILAGEVLNIVQALPEGQRVTIFLVYVEGYSYREAAEMLDIPIGTVMSRLAGARKTIVARTAAQEPIG